MEQKIFFQSSLPRSGSTLLQNIIGQNPDFYVTPTSGLCELVLSARNAYTGAQEFKAQNEEDMKQAFRSFCQAGAKAYFQPLTDKKYVLDKSRGWLYYNDFLDFFYPNSKLVCMVRDPRAIFASMEKNFRKYPEKSSELINNGKIQGITTEQRIDIWANNIPVGISLMRLYEVLLQKRHKETIFIRYEDLVSNKQTELDKIYNHFGVDTFKHDFDNVEQITQEDDKIYGIFGDHKIRQKVEPKAPDYADVLGVAACDWIYNRYRWFYDYFNYGK